MRDWISIWVVFHLSSILSILILRRSIFSFEVSYFPTVFNAQTSLYLITSPSTKMAVVVKGWLNVSPDITYLAECTPSLCSLDYATLKYIPSEMGNIAFMSLYGILLFAIVFMSFFHYRTLSFTVLMSLGFVCEVVGYWGRVQLHYYVFDPGYFVM